MYSYLTLDDGTEVVHSELLDGERSSRVLVHFERPAASGFDSVRLELPSYAMEVWEGSFPDKEVAFLRDFLETNTDLLYQHAQHRSL